MEKMIHWDFADDFSGREAAYLIAGLNPSTNSIEQEYTVQPIIKKLKKVYWECAKSFSHQMEHSYMDGLDPGENVPSDFDDRGAMYRFIKHHREPGTQLMSADIEKIVIDFHESDYVKKGYAIANYFDSKIKTETEAAEISAEQEDGSTHWGLMTAAYQAGYDWNFAYMHEFDEQRFSRTELHRWIIDNDFPTAYQFSKKNAAPLGADAPISTKERNTLLVMIAALGKKANIDLQGRNSASDMVRLAADVGVSMSDDTARKVLKKIPGALSARGK